MTTSYIRKYKWIFVWKHSKDCNLMYVSTYSRPNLWYRFWQRVLMGIKWERR